MSSIEKESRHMTLYMPKWDWSELYNDNEALQFIIGKIEMQRQYALFGGSTRYCLCIDDEFIKRDEEEIIEAIEKSMPLMN
jgi:hypothetical protein